MEWVLDIERPAVPVPPEALLDAMSGGSRRGAMPPEMLVAVASNGRTRRLESDKTYPRITSVAAMRDGSSWVRENAFEDEGVVPWVVVSREGVPQGRVLLPPTARPLDGDGKRVLLRMPGVGDFPYLAEFELAGTMNISISPGR